MEEVVRAFPTCGDDIPDYNKDMGKRLDGDPSVMQSMIESYNGDTDNMGRCVYYCFE